MADKTWQFEDDTTSVTADGVAGSPPPTITVGEEVTMTVIAEAGGVESSRLSVYNFFKDHDKTLNESAYDYGLDYRGQPYFREEFHPAAPITTHVLKVTPGADVDSAYEFWGLITSVEDQSPLVGAGEKLEVTFFVLSDTTEHATRTDVENNLRSEL